MEVLLSIVEANAKAKALAVASASSHHAVEDCAEIGALCDKVLPCALSALEPTGSPVFDDQANDCVKALTLSMSQLEASLRGLADQEQGNNGVLGILLEQPQAWLDLYRGFRSLTAHLTTLSTLVRTASQGRRESVDGALQASLRSLLAICSRARDAAALLGSDLPAFSRAASAAGLGPERLATALSAARPLHPCAQPHRPAPPPAGCNGTLDGSSSPTAQRANWVSLRSGPGSKAAASGNGASRPGSSGASPAGSDSGRCGAAALTDAAAALVSRVQELILFDSEIDQLEQDRAYLADRVVRLGRQAAAPACAAEAEAAAAALLQSEVLMAAVCDRIRALHELAECSSVGRGGCGADAECDVSFTGVSCWGKASNGGGGGAKGTAACSESGSGGAGSASRAASEASTGRWADQEDLYDDVRRRRAGWRWLPSCFVGA